ncbi:hypothetical protein L6V77_12370, partial [Myxococcota bacterium]|nr:hypothetical protein [Myxococcota bacterium]
GAGGAGGAGDPGGSGGIGDDGGQGGIAGDGGALPRPRTDASDEADAGREADAGQEADAGRTATGCGCRATGDGGLPAGGLVWFGLGALLRGRRRRGSVRRVSETEAGTEP